MLSLPSKWPESHLCPPLTGRLALSFGHRHHGQSLMVTAAERIMYLHHLQCMEVFVGRGEECFYIDCIELHALNASVQVKKAGTIQIRVGAIAVQKDKTD
ncbi:hypothetical protein RRG08_029859 [Elysia crispata]|uniref:Uncharacterized protein n=1 Tax=Elysia crispata TaxID=231223 RepID=A0AAE1CZW8_9GAST|nr:hypothetical protein RRG08_029859 [Elysia crispata]